jgi:hypothetical protein
VAQIAPTIASKIRPVMGRSEIANRPAIYVTYFTISLRIALHTAKMAECTVSLKGVGSTMVSLFSRRTMADPAIRLLKVLIVSVINADVLWHIIHYGI